MKRIVIVITLLAGVYVGYSQQISGEYPAEVTSDTVWQPGQMVSGTGEVVKVLSDDTHGDRHQRFIIELPSGRTLLVAHNIDLAPRVPNLAPGSALQFYGQYESNDKGGVIHWTHKDPQGRHADGWLEYDGQRYD